MDLMLSPTKIIQITKKLHKVPVLGKKKASYPRIFCSDKMNRSASADKGTFVIYTIDKKRFVLPLQYLKIHIFLELFKMSEEEFGTSSSGPIVFPCNSVLMKYIVSLAQLGMSTDLKKALLDCIFESSFSESTLERQEQTSQHLLLCGY